MSTLKLHKGDDVQEPADDRRLTNGELFSLLRGLRAVAELRGGKFAYAVAKNTDIVGREVRALEAANQPPPAFIAYDQARIDLCKEHAEKGEDGEPVVDGSEFVIADHPTFDAAFAELRGEHAVALDERTKQLAEYRALLAERSDVELHLLDEEHVPTDISGAELLPILPILR